MDTIYSDARISDERRREELFAGQLFTYGPVPATVAFIEMATSLIREAFGNLDPETAQNDMPVEEYAALLSDLKPKFIHHPDSKACIRDLLNAFGCDLERTYFDVPRMRTATSDGYLTTGIAYAFHPHRDTWYSAPHSQVNWWMPIYAIESGRSMAFHPRYWTHPVRNSSRTYDYAEWNRSSRYIAAQQIGTDNRVQPRAEEDIDLDPQVRLVTPPGGIVLFSGAQLHSTVPNATGRTRFSIDFRTVHLDDVESFRGARNIDSECTGTTLGDFLRASDFQALPQRLIESYEQASRRIVVPERERVTSAGR